MIPHNKEYGWLKNYEPKQIVSPYWLEDCIKLGKEIKVQYYHSPINLPITVKPDKVIVIGVSGFIGQERCYLAEVAKRLGMVYQEKLLKHDKDGVFQTTHLICDRPEGSKYKAALKWQLKIVTKEWLLECLKECDLVSELPFQIHDNIEQEFRAETNDNFQANADYIVTKQQTFKSNLEAPII